MNETKENVQRKDSGEGRNINWGEKEALKEWTAKYSGHLYLSDKN